MPSSYSSGKAKYLLALDTKVLQVLVTKPNGFIQLLGSGITCDDLFQHNYEVIKQLIERSHIVCQLLEQETISADQLLALDYLELCTVLTDPNSEGAHAIIRPSPASGCR